MLQLIAFSFTLFVEIPLILQMLKRSPFMQKLNWRQRILYAAVPTMSTHPLLWVASTHWLVFLPYYPRILLLEGAVVLVEGVLVALLFHCRFMRALLISLVANTASTLFGFLLWRLIL